MSNQQIDLEDMIFFDDEIHKDISESTREPKVQENDISNVDDEDKENDVIESLPENKDDYTSQFTYLKELGLIFVDDEEFEFDGSAEKLQEAIEITKNNIEIAGATSIWNKLPDDFKPLFEYALAGGKDISHVNLLLQKSLDYDSIDLEDEFHQEKIITEHLRKTTKFDNKKIQNYINKLKLAGSLEDEASNALDELKEIDRQEKEELIKQQKQKEVEERENLINSYKTFSEVVYQMTSIDSKKKDSIIKAVWKPGKYGEFDNVTLFNYVHYKATQNPEHLAQLASIYLTYDEKKGFINDAIEKQVQSKVKKELKEVFDKFDSDKKVKETMSINTTKKNSEADKLEYWLRQTTNK